MHRASVSPAGLLDSMDAIIASPWLTSKEAASYLKIEHRTLLAWARAGKVKGHILSGTQRITWRFRAIELDAMLSATLETPAVLPEGRIN